MVGYAEAVGSGVRESSMRRSAEVDCGKNFPGGDENFSGDGVYVGVGGAVVDDAGAKAEFRLECGVGEIDAAAGHDSFQDIEIQLIELSFGQIPFAHISKTDSTQFDRG